MLKPRNYLADFVGLDLLRFLLSLAVLFRHYSNFYYHISLNVGAELSHQPFYKPLWLFYNEGQLAVQFFWLISGLIFQSVYFKEITSGEITFKRFAILRLTRLYPLHFATLLLVTLLQFAHFLTSGRYFLDLTNNLADFVMQIFFVANWFPDRNLSYNIPIWSVSIEVLVYIVFYLITLAGLTKNKSLYIVILITVVLRFFGILAPFHECLLYFFCGCLLARLLASGVPVVKLAVIYGVAFVVLGMVAFVQFDSYPDLTTFIDGFEFRLWLVPSASLTVIAFILTFRNVRSGRITTLMKSMGNMTYSIYLIHFPIQIIIFLILRPQSYVIFNNPLILITFVGAAILAGWLLFEYFERPAQKYLRNILTRKEAAADAEQKLEPPENVVGAV
jgi:peptidoglycan/LPS O-acetylase OafA/YrhL